MNSEPTILRSLLRLLSRTAAASVGLILCSFAIYLTLLADVGLAPWNALNEGVAAHLPITFGQASISISILILIADLLLKEPIGIGTLLDAFLVGWCVDLFSAMELFPVQTALPSQLLFLFVSIVIECFGQYLYMKAALCCGPRDALLVGLGKLFCRFSIGTVNLAISILVLTASVLLGSTIGIGTVIMVFGKGIIMDFIFHLLHFEAREVNHESILQVLPHQIVPRQKQIPKP